jgi:MYXO-CTERM domain-containing protein
MMGSGSGGPSHLQGTEDCSVAGRGSALPVLFALLAVVRRQRRR